MRIAIAALAVVALGGRAEAKYDGDPCHHGGGQYALSSPEPVPRNAKLWLAEPFRLPASHFRVRGPGVDRIVTRERWGDFADLGELEPDARYVVTVPELGGFELAVFETSSDDDTAAPPAPELRSVAVEASGRTTRRYDDFARGNVADVVGLDVGLSDDTAFVELDDSSGRARHTLWRGDLELLGRTTCGPTADIRDDRACVTIRAVDLAGNRSAPVTRCAVVAPASAFSDRQPIPLRAFPPPAPKGSRVPVVAAILAWLAVGWLAFCRRAVFAGSR